MDRTTFSKHTVEAAVTPSQADHPSVSNVNDSGSQGTDSVRGTWSSEGHAGRHFRTEAQRRGALKPPLVQPRLDRIAEQYRILCAKLRGHYQYYGVRCNSKCLDMVYYTAVRAWRYWLNRRGGRQLTWQAFGRLMAQFPLPRPRIVQAWV